MTEPIDEYVVQQVKDFQGKTLMSATKENLQYDVSDGIVIGMLPFSTDPEPNQGFSMTTVTEDAKKTMLTKIEQLEIVKGTCITTGLFAAVQDPNYLNNEEGNACVKHKINNMNLRYHLLFFHHFFCHPNISSLL